MSKRTLFLKICAGIPTAGYLLFSLLVTSPAHAQLTRTFRNAAEHSGMFATMEKRVEHMPLNKVPAPTVEAPSSKTWQPGLHPSFASSARVEATTFSRQSTNAFTQPATSTLNTARASSQRARPTITSFATAPEKTILTVGAKSNYNRFVKKMPANAKSNASFKSAGNGNYLFSATSPAKNIPGSGAIYRKEVNASGVTVDMKKITFAPDGKVVHVKDKH
jgi:hypothetical protein